jgi:predicted AlkP superfamily pyrophosphatase or phosphodiesterase
MKHKIIVFVALFLQLNSFAQRTKKVVFIIADGIPADVLERIKTPNLDKITKMGALMRACVGGNKGTYSETPTVSAPGYNNLITGTWANKHNVFDNEITAPDYNYKNVFRLVKEAAPNKKIAVFSSWLDNRTKLVGEGLSSAGDIHFDYHADGYELDTTRFPHANPVYMHNIDEKVVSEAAACIHDKAPDLSWIYLEYTDDMGHEHGDSKEFYTAVEYVDKQVGKILEATTYREKNFKEDWMIVVTTDHGRTAKNGSDHGGQSSRERNTWIATNAPGLNIYSKLFVPGIVDILPSITRFMQIDIPMDAQRELDGIPFIGKLSLVRPEVNLIQNKIDVNWKTVDTTGTVKVWLTTTNNFKMGGKDAYVLMAEVPAGRGEVLLDIQTMPSAFYKIILEGKYNTVNRWIVEETAEKK